MKDKEIIQKEIMNLLKANLNVCKGKNFIVYHLRNLMVKNYMVSNLNEINKLEKKILRNLSKLTFQKKIEKIRIMEEIIIKSGSEYRVKIRTEVFKVIKKVKE